MSITRRALMHRGAMALVGTTAIPTFLARTVLAAPAPLAQPNQRLVVIFQRGAADGLNIVVPHAEPFYYQARTSIAIPKAQVLDLDGQFGLHPALASFQPLWNARQLAIVHACGSPDPSRSHFDAQDYMESGTPGVRTTTSGWLNRALATGPGGSSPFRAVCMGADVALTMRGPVEAIAMTDLRSFAVGGSGGASDLFQTMYDGSTSSVLRGTGKETFEATKMLQSADPARYTPAHGAQYPAGQFGDSMRQVAQLMKANLGVEVAFADIGGWDHHVNEGAVDGQLAHSLRELSQGLTAFWQDMGDDAENITVVTMSEFGRTVHQNGTGGTDHGHANAMFVLGGSVAGGKVYGQWPGLNPEQLHEGRDLAVTTDYRQVLAEAAWKQLGARDLGRIFPASHLSQQSFLNILPTRAV